jgi:transcriptional regulator with XRE-family HTH domain
MKVSGRSVNMPSMPSQNLDPSNAHLKAAGQRLQDARLAQDISVDTVMRELRVTRLQISGIESGNPKSFYNESFFIDLLKRYARLLNFSETAIAKMISPPVIEVVKPPEPDVESSQAAGVTQADPASETSQAPEAPQASVPVSASTEAPTDDSAKETGRAHEAQASAPPDEVGTRTSGSRLVGVLALVVLLGGGVAVGLQMTASTDSASVATAPAPAPAAASVAAPAEPAPAAAAVPPEAPPPPAPVAAAEPVKSEASAVPAAAQTVATPATAAPAAAVKPTDTRSAQTSASDPQKTDEPQTAAKTIVDTPMTLTAKQKSWIWVRDASDQVRQFGVAQGQTVKFDQLPIYIVVHDPTVFEVIIGNKVIPLVRNNDERNVARHTRTDLINFYKQ